jgi:hypothetical protein
MEENVLRLSSRELYYSAMLLRLERIVNISYDFPADESAMKAELDDAKRSLHKKNLLRENSKGEIVLNRELVVCAAYCAKPGNCVVVEENGIAGALYCTEDAVMLLEEAGEDVYEARWFADMRQANGFIERRVEENTAKEAADNGGA